jgi:hypothetical protein
MPNEMGFHTQYLGGPQFCTQPFIRSRHLDTPKGSLYFNIHTSALSVPKQSFAMSFIFCCSRAQPYKNKTLPEESTIRTFLAWAEYPKQSEVDASTPDASTPDASTPDASTPDASTPDASTPDASTPDASTPDASTPDASSSNSTRDMQLIKQDNFGPCEGKRYFVSTGARADRKAFVEVTEQWLIDAHFQKLHV